MQPRRQNGQTKGIIIDYNGFLCKINELEICLKIMDYNQL